MKSQIRPEFPITYAGFADGRHCYRIDFSGAKTFEAYAFKTTVSNFLLIELDSDASIDNRAPFANPEGRDFFVYLAKMPDIVRFEDTFGVTGYTPRLVA